MSFKMQSVFARMKRSWTVYVNLLSALLAGAEMQFHLLETTLGDKIYPIAYFALIMVNIALRFKTELKHYTEKNAIPN